MPQGAPSLVSPGTASLSAGLGCESQQGSPRSRHTSLLLCDSSRWNQICNCLAVTTQGASRLFSRDSGCCGPEGPSDPSFWAGCLLCPDCPSASRRSLLSVASCTPVAPQSVLLRLARARLPARVLPPARRPQDLARHVCALRPFLSSEVLVTPLFHDCVSS